MTTHPLEQAAYRAWVIFDLEHGDDAAARRVHALNDLATLRRLLRANLIDLSTEGALVLGLVWWTERGDGNPDRSDAERDAVFRASTGVWSWCERRGAPAPRTLAEALDLVESAIANAEVPR